MNARVDDLEIEQDLAFQRREWRTQRAAWRALSIFVLLATLGVFGSGPLSSAQAGEDGAPLRIEYERFVRAGARSRLALHLGSSAPEAAGMREVTVNRDYFEALRIDRITPEPQRIFIGPDEVTLLFATEKLSADSTILLDAELLRAGLYDVHLGADNHGRLSFSQIVYF